MNFNDWNNSYNDSKEVLDRIVNVEKLLDVYGRFPTFVDAEIVDMQCFRGNTIDCIDSGQWINHLKHYLTVTFYVFDERYSSSEYLRKPSFLKMSFIGLVGFIVDGFNYQNSICGLGIRKEYSNTLKKDVFRVDWGGGAIQHKVSLVCEEIKILDVQLKK